jgi:hypothetical protein
MLSKSTSASLANLLCHYVLHAKLMLQFPKKNKKYDFFSKSLYMQHRFQLMRRPSYANAFHNNHTSQKKKKGDFFLVKHFQAFFP